MDENRYTNDYYTNRNQMNQGDASCILIQREPV